MANVPLSGKGIGAFLNKLITENKTLSLNLVGTNYCGPDFQSKQKIEAGIPPTNKADNLCRLHDLRYIHAKSSADRLEADKELIRGCKELLASPDTSFYERLLARLIMKTMQAKVLLGGGKNAKAAKRGGGVQKRQPLQGGNLPLILSAISAAATIGKTLKDLISSGKNQSGGRSGSGKKKKISGTSQQKQKPWSGGGKRKRVSKRGRKRSTRSRTTSDASFNNPWAQRRVF